MNFLFDIVAGISVGITLIPISTAYATLAGVPLETGLHTTATSFFVYAIFGTVKQTFVAPSSIISLIIYNLTYDMNLDFVVLLTFLTGCIQFVLGIARLGYLVVNFISMPVVIGFINGATISIVIASLPGILGIKFHARGCVERIILLAQHIHETKYWSDLPMGVSCIIVLLILSQLGRIKFKGESKVKGLIGKIFLVIALSRNGIVVLLAVGATAIFEHYWKIPFNVAHNIEAGFPPINFPPFSTNMNDKEYNFQDMINLLSYRIIIMPVMSGLVSITLAKSYSKGKYIELTQEFIAVSFCNLVGSFTGSMPVSGAIIGSAIAHNCNVQTPAAGIYTGLLSLLTLGFLTPYIHLIPEAALAAVLFYSVLIRFDYKSPYRIWKVDKIDFAIMSITFLFTIGFYLTIGLVVGIALSLFYLLYLWAYPKVTHEFKQAPDGTKYMEVFPDRGMYYPAVDRLRDNILQNHDPTCPTVLNCLHISEFDYTAVKGMEQLTSDLETFGQTLILYNVKPQIIEKCSISSTKLIFCQDKKELDSALVLKRRSNDRSI